MNFMRVVIMISGVNFVELNQKNKVKQKKIDKLPKKEKARVVKNHINYIGRVEGAENNGEHSLFGTINNDDKVYEMEKRQILSYIENKVSKGAYVYKTVITMT